MVTIESTVYVLSQQLAEKLQGESAKEAANEASAAAVRVAAAARVVSGFETADNISRGTFHVCGEHC